MSQKIYPSIENPSLDTGVGYPEVPPAADTPQISTQTGAAGERPNKRHRGAIDESIPRVTRSRGKRRAMEAESSSSPSKKQAQTPTDPTSVNFDHTYIDKTTPSTAGPALGSSSQISQDNGKSPPADNGRVATQKPLQELSPWRIESWYGDTPFSQVASSTQSTAVEFGNFIESWVIQHESSSSLGSTASKARDTVISMHCYFIVVLQEYFDIEEEGTPLYNEIEDEMVCDLVGTQQCIIGLAFFPKEVGLLVAEAQARRLCDEEPSLLSESRMKAVARAWQCLLKGWRKHKLSPLSLDTLCPYVRDKYPANEVRNRLYITPT